MLPQASLWLERTWEGLAKAGGGGGGGGGGGVGGAGEAGGESDLGNGLDCCHPDTPGLAQGAMVQVRQHSSHQRLPQRLQVHQTRWIGLGWGRRGVGTQGQGRRGAGTPRGGGVLMIGQQVNQIGLEPKKDRRLCCQVSYVGRTRLGQYPQVDQIWLDLRWECGRLMNTASIGYQTVHVCCCMLST